MQKCNPALSHTLNRRLNRLYAVVRMEQSCNPPRNKLELMDSTTAACLKMGTAARNRSHADQEEGQHLFKVGVGSFGNGEYDVTKIFFLILFLSTIFFLILLLSTIIFLILF